jgi:prophage tail gpP-like protein
MADARLSGYELTAVVKGHRMESGKLWLQVSVFVYAASPMVSTIFSF